MSLRKILPTLIRSSFDRTVFDQKLQDLEADLERFKLNYAQFLADWAHYTEQYPELTRLEAQLEEARLEPHPAEQSPSDAFAESPPDLQQKSIQQEYDRLRHALLEIEQRWESQFFSWEGFGTVFWQVVRFLGLGILIGWGLRGCAGG